MSSIFIYIGKFSYLLRVREDKTIISTYNLFLCKICTNNVTISLYMNYKRLTFPLQILHIFNAAINMVFITNYLDYTSNKLKAVEHCIFRYTWTPWPEILEQKNGAFEHHAVICCKYIPKLRIAQARVLLAAVIYAP